jgi:hypothetical protein
MLLWLTTMNMEGGIAADPPVATSSTGMNNRHRLQTKRYMYGGGYRHIWTSLLTFF